MKTLCGGKTIWYFLHTLKVFFHFSDTMNIHPCLDKYFFILIAQVYMNTEFQKIPCTTLHKKSILQESSLSMWVGVCVCVCVCVCVGRQGGGGRERKTVVPFTNGLTNVLYTTNNIFPQRVMSCTCYSTDITTLVFKNACNWNIKHSKY